MEWKNNAPYVLCISHDVDRIKKQWYHYLVYGIKHPFVQIRSLVEKIRFKDPYWNFETLIEIEKEYGAKSTFFFLNESHKEFSANFMGRYNINSSKIRNIIERLDSDGFEIGLHGSFYSYDNEQLLTREKDTLESIVGHDVVSTRQHHLNFDSNKTWAIQKKIGLKYDSTSGYSKKVGDFPFARTDEGMIEIPITLMDTVDIDDKIYEECCEIADSGGVVMLNFHQCHFNRIEYPQNVDIYIRMLKKAKADGAWITNVGDIGRWLDEHI